MAFFNGYGVYHAYFPLTPALSLPPSLRSYGVTGGERAPRRQPGDQPKVLSYQGAASAIPSPCLLRRSLIERGLALPKAIAKAEGVGKRKGEIGVQTMPSVE